MNEVSAISKIFIENGFEGIFQISMIIIFIMIYYIFNSINYFKTVQNISTILDAATMANYHFKATILNHTSRDDLDSFFQLGNIIRISPS